MDNKEQIIEKLKHSMTINGIVNKRFYHSLEVAKMALKLNKHLKLGLDENQVYLAGLLHDAAKLKSDYELWSVLEKCETLESLEELKKYPAIWHSFAGKYIVKEEYKIQDIDVLDAIYYHTTGKPQMTTLQKLIFVSDYIEESRVGPWVISARAACFLNLTYGVKIILGQMVDYLKKSGKIIYSLTFDAYKFYENGDDKND